MKRNYFISELTISLIIVLLLLLHIRPFSSFMPSNLFMFTIVALLALFTLFVIFVWREKIYDEREKLHALIAGKAAFLVGASVMVIGIVVQSLNHSVDIWLVVTLGAMIFTKIIGLIYGQFKH